MADVNVVPLIDILLVLIIIFMVISPVSPKGHDAVLPQPGRGGELPEAVLVRVGEGGELRINNELHSWDTLGTRVEQIFRLRAEKVAFICGDGKVLFAQVARVIDVVRANGVERVALVTPPMEMQR